MNHELINKINEQLKTEDKIDPSELDKLKEEKTLTLKKPDDGLNDDQRQGMGAILDWLYSYKGSRNENAFFALRGSAGTGKTTLIGTLLKVIDKNKYSSSTICISAPTHKAKKVIGLKTGWANLETLQSLLGLRVDVNIEDFDPNNPHFSVNGKRKIDDYRLIIIDESSMINSKLYQLLSDTCKGVMILFVGDHIQLSPVKEHGISLALTAPIHSYTLTKPARQKVTNPLLPYLNILRDDIENGTSTYKDIFKGLPKNINAEGEGYFATSNDLEFADLLKQVFACEDFKTNKDHVRYIAWTNASVTKTNRWVRKNAFGYTSTLEKGELLLAYKTVLVGEELLLVNSDDYIVEDVKPVNISDYALPLQAIKACIAGVDTGYKSDVLMLDREQINYQNYMSVYDEHLMEAKFKGGQVWTKKFYPFVDHILTMDEMEYKTEEMIKAEKIKKKIDYGYGITAHKSQGSTYNTVFVNMRDISQITSFCKPHEVADMEVLKKRLLYVALSRASKMAYIIM